MGTDVASGVLANFLRCHMADARVQVDDLGRWLGMSGAALSRKLSGYDRLTVDEADAALRALGLTWTDWERWRGTASTAGDGRVAPRAVR